MKMRDRDLLVRYMDDKDFSGARLGRYAGVSRQFIYMLVSGSKSTCSDEVGQLIEEALGVLPGTLFVPEGSRVERRTGRAVRTPAVATVKPAATTAARSVKAARKTLAGAR